MTSAGDWSGRVGEVWAEEWRRTDRSFAGLAPHLDAAILAAAPSGPFTALDIGCGAGITSIALAHARPDARVIGVDLSTRLVATARDRAADLPNCRFEVGDAVAAAAGLRPDLIVSRHGMMFFPEPEAAFVALRAAAAPGARLVFSCFADLALNPWASLADDARPSPLSDAPGPFAFANPDRVRALLTRAGWAAAIVDRIDYAYRIGEGADPVADALAFLSRIGPVAATLREAPRDARPAIEAQLRARLAAARDGDAIDFPAAAWLWSATAPSGEAA